MGTRAILGAIALVLCLLSCPPVSAQTERRVALVIGNAAYPENPLKNPINDARAMASVLKQSGFHVIVRENATKQDMERAVGEFGRALQPGAVALFYYAGHGVQVNGRNYLIPVDASIESEHNVRLETLDIDLVLDQIASRGSDVNLVILDACRNNPFERRFRSRGGGGLAQIDAPKGTLIAYATAPGKTALDGAGENGVYTARLVEAMKTPGLPVEEVFKRVRAEVSRETADAQTPWEASSLVGQFYFNAPATVVVNPGTDRDAIHWQSVKDSADAALVQTYLDKYPDGAFAVLARARVEELRRPLLLAAFDGAWAGTYKCGAIAGSNLAGWTEANRLFAIKAGRIAGVARWRQEDGVTGRVSYTGSVDAAGTVTIVGLGTYDAGGRTYRVFHRGRIADGRLTAEGRDGSRDCSLDYRRLPPVNEAAAARTAGGAASFDGTWQGMHRCSATSDGKHGPIANSGKQLTIKDAGIEEELRWRVPETGATGTDSYTGLVGDDGGFVLVGKGMYDSGASYRLYYYGRVAGGLLTASGRNGSRDCTMDLVRVTAAGAAPRPKP